MSDGENPKKKTEKVAKGEDRRTYSARTESGSMDEPKGRNPHLDPRESNDRTDQRHEIDPRSWGEKRENATQSRNELGQSSGYRVPPRVAEDCRQCRYGECCRYNHPSERNQLRHEMVQTSLYPVRPDVQDCEHYIRTGQCSFGSNCLFNHPPTHHAPGQSSGCRVHPPVAEDCLEYLRTGQCRHCRFNHPPLQMGHGMVQTSLDPVRPPVPDCEQYIQTGLCIYRSSCIFNHPPTHIAPYFLGGYCTLGSDTEPMRQAAATTSYQRVDKRRHETESSSRRGAKRAKTKPDSGERVQRGNTRNMGIGGRKDKNSGKDDKKKKGKEIEIAEDDMPRSKKYMEEEKTKGKMVKVSDEGYDIRMNWDWRVYAGIISNILEQGDELICWAISFIRAVEALFNIGKRIEEQHSFSIQHLVNNVNIGSYGLESCESLGEFVKKNGVLEEGQCSYTATKQTCSHQDNPEVAETIDDFVVIDKVLDDVDLAKLVWRHPVVGVLPLWTDFESHGKGIYRPRHLEYTRLTYHAVLIIGFGVDESGNYYWIVQNSWGKRWGIEGFGLLQRQHIRGRRSLFVKVYYGVKNGYPQQKKK